MQLTQLDYYTALDIRPSASFDQIERAYRAMLDSYGHEALASYGLLQDDERDEILTFLEKARRTLGDKRLREDYDKSLLALGRFDAAQFQREPEPEAKKTSWWPFAEKEKAPQPDLAVVRAVSEPAQAEPAPAHVPPPAHAEPARPAPPPAPEAPPATPVGIPALDGRPIGGDEIRQIREARGVSLHDLAEKTKISMSTLRQLEGNQYRLLPATVYVKGFIRTLAKILQFDADKAVNDYLREYEAHRGNG